MAPIEQAIEGLKLNASNEAIVSDGKQVSTLVNKSTQLQDEVINDLRNNLTSVVDGQGFDISQSALERPKILLLGDSHLRHMVQLTKACFAEEYLVQCFFKPNGTLENVVEDIDNLTRDFDDKDYVVIMAGANDALNGAAIKEESLTKIAASLVQTNLIEVSVPYLKKMPAYNQIAEDINSKLCKFIESKMQNQSAYFVDINYILTDDDRNRLGVHLQMSGKYKILEYIGKHIDNMRNVGIERSLSTKICI